MAVTSFLYGVVCYLVFLLTVLDLIGFLGNFLAPKGIDSGESAVLATALLINGLIVLSGSSTASWPIQRSACRC
jgi:hypothetical protein